MICLFIIFLDLVAQGFGTRLLEDTDAMHLASILEIMFEASGIGAYLVIKGD